MKRLAIPIIAGLVGGGLWAGIGPSISVGLIPYGEIALYGSWFLAGPLMLVSALLLVIPRARRGLFPGIGIGISGFLLVSLVGVSRADNLKRTENRRAKTYCEQLIQKLDAYKTEHGDYPDRIDELLPPDRRSLPIYLRDGGFYTKGTNGFSLGWADSPRFPVCSGVSSYHHETGKWDGCADWGG
jgi:hypothetical protein